MKAIYHFYADASYSRDTLPDESEKLDVVIEGNLQEEDRAYLIDIVKEALVNIWDRREKDIKVEIEK